jgi:16S rRNA G1207 methylase RsmC
MYFDAKRLRSILTQLPLPQHILELGCGAFSEASVYRQMFPEAMIVGVDNNESVLEQARHTNRALNIAFALADGTAMPFAKVFDLILIRHPNIDRHRQSWKQIFIDANKYLKPGGHLVATVYSLPEYEQVLEKL